MSNQPAKKKPGITKKAERRFFHYFNDKSSGRRVVFMGLLAVAPTYAVSGIFNEDPSRQRTGGESALVSMQNYQREIDSIASATPTVLATAHGQQTLEQRATNLATSVILDRNLSEADKEHLATRFLQSTHMPSGSAAESLFDRARVRAPYLQTHVKVTFNDPQLASSPPVQKANHVLKESVVSSLYDKAGDFALAYFIFFSFFELRARRVLKKGREKDDKLKQEVRTETAEEKLARLKELITPKTGDGPKPR